MGEFIFFFFIPIPKNTHRYTQREKRKTIDICHIEISRIFFINCHLLSYLLLISINYKETANLLDNIIINNSIYWIILLHIHICNHLYIRVFICVSVLYYSAYVIFIKGFVRHLEKDIWFN